MCKVTAGQSAIVFSLTALSGVLLFWAIVLFAVVRSQGAELAALAQPAPQAATSTSSLPILEGSAQFTLLGLVLATVAYIRNIPYRDLLKSLGSTDNSSGESTSLKPWKRWPLQWILLQLLLLDALQVILASLGFLIMQRELNWFGIGKTWDQIILATCAGLALSLLAMHILANGRGLLLAAGKLWDPASHKKSASNTPAAPTAPAQPGASKP